jgi:HlyD family secretion protein
LADPSSIFRKSATEHTASPDALDRALRVTGPRSWIALGALGAVVLLALVWSVLGEVPTQLPGQGILLRTEGLARAVASAPGRLEGLTVAPGDAVQVGEVLGTVAQPELRIELAGARAELIAAQAEAAALARFRGVDATQQQALFRSRREETTRTIAEAAEEARWHTERAREEEALAAQGLIPEDQLVETRRKALTERAREEAARTRLREIDLEELAWRNRSTQDGAMAQLEVERAERTVAALEERIREAAGVVSPVSGRVVEVMAGDGQVVVAGEPLLLLEPVGGPLEALVYLPAADGKRAQEGMVVRIAPSTIRPEEFGYMVGRVRSVSPFPATSRGMQRVLQNEGLVTTLSADGMPFEVFVELERDETTASGYRWTSVSGPPAELVSGTLVSALVIERTQRPIELVFPFLRGLLGR